MKSRETRRVVMVAMAVAVAAAACTSPETNPVAPGRTAATSSAGAVTSQADVQFDPIFATEPVAVNGEISGPSPLTVLFNQCPTFDRLDRNLKFTYDFDGNDVIDDFGHCRMRHVYESASGVSCTEAVVCIANGAGDEKACARYRVCAFGPEEPVATPTPRPTKPPCIYTFSEVHTSAVC